MSARRSNGSGCLGCATVLALIVACVMACVMAVAYMAGPTTALRTVQAYTERTLENIGVSEPKEYDPGSHGHAWNQLNEVGQRAYQVLLEGVQNFEESIVVIEATADDVEAAYSAMMNDHPELFWLDGSYSYITPEIIDSVTVKPGFGVDPSEVASLRVAIEAEADAILAEVGEGASQYEIARHAYEHIAATTDYDVSAPHNQTIQSVLLNHRSVCAGYARTYQYLLHRAGIACAYVEGHITSSDEDHAWNMVCIDGQYAYVDPTWADPTYLGADDKTATDNVIYDYLCLTTEEVLRDDHTFENPDEWPLCDAPNLDYYRREGLYFDEYDEYALDQGFWAQVDAGGRVASFKFGNDEAYGEAVAALAAGNFQRDNLLALVSDGADSIQYSYSVSDGLRIVKLYW